ncbi:MAG TPA: hypothetical protein ENI98_11545 [Gammaproteobacteria bacterium]|nr:hypothetical protein [Gammaproteobacteria bacterium]
MHILKNLATVSLYLVTLTTLFACGGGGGGVSSDKPSIKTDPIVNTGTQCQRTLAPPSTGQCDIQVGDSNWLIQGNILRSNGILAQGEVLVVDNSIACVGCDCSTEVGAASASVLTCASALVTPGLINSHDHLTFAQNSPVDTAGERYNHRHEWRLGINGATTISVAPGGSTAAQWGELRQVMAGTTSILGSSTSDGMLRNLDRAQSDPIADHDTVKLRTFPLGDSNGSLSLNCADYSIAAPPAPPFSAHVPHVAEGVDNFASNEFRCLNGSDPNGADYRAATTAYINSVGLNASDTKTMADAGMGMIWSPRSNTYLYGTTTPIPNFKQQGGLVALGTDWSVSGSINLLRELACAAEWNDRWSGLFTDQEMADLVTENAAKIAGFDDVIGSLTVGKLADITIWNGSANTGSDAIFNAGNDDVILVLRGGLPLYGDDSILSAITTLQDCETIDVCGTSKRLCAAREFGATSNEIATSLGGSPYPLFACATPAGEPSCAPSRPTEYTGIASADDTDGDGVLNANDNCPTMFNPALPADNGIQSDIDTDGIGDICDPTPL